MNKRIINAALIGSSIYELFRILGAVGRIWGYLNTFTVRVLLTSSDGTVSFVRYAAMSSLAEIVVCIVLAVLCIKAYRSVNKQTEQ